jgi:hypothetical protein
MPEEATSLHLRNTHELFLLIPVKQGFVEGPDRRISYASRLRRLLELLFAPSQSVIERSLMPRASFGDKLQNLYHFHYGVVDRFQRSELILSATFDSSWETYFRNLVDETGDFLDAVFCHCEGFAGRTCADGYEAFADFIRQHQVQAGILFAATPDLTADDLRILRARDRGQAVPRPFPSTKDEVTAKREREAWTQRYSSDEWQGEAEFRRLRAQGVRQLVEGIFELRKYFPSTDWVDVRPAGYVAPGPQKKRTPDDPRSARNVFDDVVGLLADSLKEDLDQFVANLQHVPEGTNATLDYARQIQSLRTDGKRSHRPERTFEKSDVQRDIVEPVGSQQGVLALLRFPPGKAAHVLSTLEGWVKEDAPFVINLGLTYSGLRRLGLEESTLEKFPKEFRTGMERRSGTLGDVGWPSHPDFWHQVGLRDRRVKLAAVDLVLVVHKGPEVSEARAFTDQVRSVLERALPGALLHYEYLYHRAHDFFGHATTPSSQPQLTPHPPQERKAGFDNRIAHGDLFLGHIDTHGEVAKNALASANPSSWELFLNGTFLVVRKLAQDATAFDAHLHAVDRDLPSALGRPPILSDKQDYRDAPQKTAVPLDAHVRRVNPRTARVPRVVRRSFSYGPEVPAPGDDYGHMFLAYNASAAQQFEVLQRWINGGNSTGIASRENDPVAGNRPDAEKPSPVTLRWGMYLFVPSKLALEFLVDVALPNEKVTTQHARARRDALQAAEQTWLRERGETLLAQLDAESDPAVARQSWKQLFEEAAWNRDARAVWAVIRASGRPKHTPYGLLVGTVRGARDVLENRGSLYSTREYGKRLLESSLHFYLGLDEVPNAEPAGCPIHRGYKQLAVANESLHNFFPAALDLFDEARRDAAKFLELNKGSFDLRDVARQVVGLVSQRWIGLPRFASDQELREFLEHFINVTRYMSFPYPEDWLRARSQESGCAVLQAYGTNPKEWGGAYAEVATGYAFPNQLGPGQVDDLRSALIGANIGFVPPAISMIVGVLSRWLENGDLENLTPLPLVDLAKDLRDAHYEAFLPILLRELRFDPTFATIYRTATDRHPDVAGGTYVIAGVQSAYEGEQGKDDPAPYEWLFGGRYRQGAHACPFPDHSLAVIAGAVQGVTDFLEHALSQNPNRTLTRVGPTRYEVTTILRSRPRSAIESLAPR